MFRRREVSRGPEDPHVAAVEQLLTAAASEFNDPTRPPERRPVVAHALWICACVTPEDAPTWLIYDAADGSIGWCRVPERLEPLDLVDADLSVGGHAVPEEVLNWLLGSAAHPWAGGGDGHGDHVVLEHLKSKLSNPDA